MVTNPHLFLWRLDAMQAAKQRSASGEPAVKPAIDRLQHDVAQSLTFQPVSVMDKEVIPPSGDKHSLDSLLSR